MSQPDLKLPSYVKLNPKVRPQDNLYDYACSHWVAKNPLPKTKARWGIFHKLQQDNEKKVFTILDDWLANKEKLTAEQKQAVLYYETLINKDKHKSQSLKSLNKIIKDINNEDKGFILEDFLAQAYLIDESIFFQFNIDVDDKNSQRYCLWLTPSPLDLPDRDYYLKLQSTMRTFRQAYLEYLNDFQKLCLKYNLDFQITPKKILEIETILADLNWPLHKVRNSQKTYNLYAWPEFCQKFKFNWELYFKKIQLKPPTDILVTQPSYLRGCLKYLSKLTPQDLKDYLIYKVLLNSSALISEEFAKLQFSFFNQILYGVKELETLEKRARQSTQGNFVDLFGQAYVKRHFPKKYQKDIQQLATNINQAFAKRLKNNDWLSDESKKKALKKIKSIIYVIGYSGHWYDYSQIKLKDNDLIQNSQTLSQVFTQQEHELLNQKPSRQRFGEVLESAQTVNAYAHPIMVATKFPAGILQVPFYNHKASLFYNLGTIGSVIGHELTHHFDDQGSLYDESGHLKPWLSKAESKAFKKAATKLMQTTNQYQVAPKIKMKGKQVIGELIADLGGLEIALDVAKDYCQKQSFNKKETKQAVQQVFIAYAYMHSTNASLESKIMLAKAGVHPDDIFRVNGIVSHCDDFYTVFDVKKDDKLYLAPKDRAKIW